MKAVLSFPCACLGTGWNRLKVGYFSSVMGFSEAVGTNDIGPEQKAAEDTVRRRYYKIARRERKSEGICDSGGFPPEERYSLEGMDIGNACSLRR